MEPAQALADIVEISSQIEAVVLLAADGAVEASTLPDAARAEALAGSAQEILARAAALDPREAQQLEVALVDGSVFVVRSSGRTIVATTRPDPTVGLVLYDLRSCLRNLADDAKPKPKAKPRRSRAKAGGDDAAA
jgi:predicted regulator of Ras-like GTPase activity (Roadblock/LC7/MglB family)